MERSGTGEPRTAVTTELSDTPQGVKWHKDRWKRTKCDRFVSLFYSANKLICAPWPASSPPHSTKTTSSASQFQTKEIMAEQNTAKKAASDSARETRQQHLAGKRSGLEIVKQYLGWDMTPKFMRSKWFIGGSIAFMTFLILATDRVRSPPFLTR